MKKLLTLIFSLMLILSLFCFPLAGNASAATDGDFKYEMSGGNAVITGFANGVDFQGELVIPDELGSFTIVGIEPEAFKDCTGITSVTIGEFIGSIAANAFAGCTNLTTVNYNATYYSHKNSAGNINNPVFEGCTNLKTVNIAANVQSLPKYLFYGVASLEKVNFAGNMPKIGDKAFEGCPNINLGNEESSSSNPTVSKPIAPKPSSKPVAPSSKVEVSSKEDAVDSDVSSITEESSSKPTNNIVSVPQNNDNSDSDGGNNTLIFVWVGAGAALLVLAAVTIILLKK